MGVILAGAKRALSVGDDNVRGPPRPGLTPDDLARLWKALLKTGLTVKEGTRRISMKGGPYELTSHCIFERMGGDMGASYMNEDKFLASLFLKTFPSQEEYMKIQVGNYGLTAEILRRTKVKGPTVEQTAAYKFFLRHSENAAMRNFLETVYDAMGWPWDNIGMAENEHVIIDLL